MVEMGDKSLLETEAHAGKRTKYTEEIKTRLAHCTEV